MALAAIAPDARASFQVFTAADGLAGDGVQIMLEDRARNIWFGTTTNGLSRFDGIRWTTFDTSDGLPADKVFDLLETTAGHVWAATNAGVARWDGTTWRAYGQADGLPADEVRQLLEDDGGRPWARIVQSGVARFDGASWTPFSTTNGLASNLVNDMLRARDGALWFATEGGVSRFDGATWTSFTTADGLANNAVLRLLESQSGAMWFGTRDGLSRRDGSQWTTFTTADGNALVNLEVLLEDDLGRLWAGTNTGLSRYDGTTWKTFTTVDGLANNAANVTLQDARGQLWFGLSPSRFGVTRWDGLAFEAFTTSDGLAENHVTDMLQDRLGNVWFASGEPGAGVTLFDGAIVRSWGRFDGLGHDLALAVEAGSSDSIWIGTAGGLRRFDGHNWDTFPSFDGDSVRVMIEDRSGRMWFGASDSVATYDGHTFETVTAFAAPILSLAEDAAGRIWAGTRTQGVYRFDGTGWTNFRASGLPNDLVHNNVRAIVQGRDGAMWFGTANGLSRFDGTSWTTYTSANGLAANFVHAAARDSSGVLWFGTEGGLSRFDGTTWQSYMDSDGLASDAVLAVHVAADSTIWLGTLVGVSRFDGQKFLNIGPSAGLAGPQVRGATSDGRGRLWFAALGGLSRLEPDRVPPRAVVVPEPQPVSESRTQTLSYAAAFGESQGILFSHTFDGGLWSSWSPPPGFVVRAGLEDGPHTFAVRARDEYGNVQDPPTVVTFEIDATPPAPIITSPFSQVVRGQIAVMGTASDARFDSLRVQVRPASGAPWDVQPGTRLAASASPITEDTLAIWDTRAWPDGNYDLRVAVTDTLGLEGAAPIRVTVDNVFPFVNQTSPARIVAAEGGHVYTTNAEVHLFFPPNAFDRDAVVALEPVAEGGVPDSLGPGITRLTSGFDLGWVGARLQKPATLEFSYAGLVLPAGATPVLFAAGSDSIWRRLGGTADLAVARVAATVESPGRLALFAEGTVPPGGGTLSALALTPRVFSPGGAIANNRIAIGFSLGRAAPVTVKIYNRAGRLVREVATGVSMGPGANLVYWDGRDRDGDLALKGLYVVTVEALDEKRTQTLAVVR